MDFRRVFVAALLLIAGGCTQTFDATSLGVPVTMASPAGEAPQGERFRVNATSLYAAWGLLTLTQADLQNALSHQLLGSRQVTDLKIRVRSKWSDILITGITLGLFIPRTVTFEGVVTGGAPADTTRQQ